MLLAYGFDIVTATIINYLYTYYIIIFRHLQTNTDFFLFFDILLKACS